jgi:hypothetical protein
VIQKFITAGIVVVVVLSMLVAVLPRITPSLVALGLLVLVARVVWRQTQR